MTSELFAKLGGFPTKSGDGSGKSSETKLDMSEEEAKRLEECFKDRKFRDLLASYCEEISNPKTRLAYEEYLRQVERNAEQPQNRKLVKPKAGFVIKLRKDPKKMNLTKTQGKAQLSKNNICFKVFINCCFAECVEDARLGPNKLETRPINATGADKAGICWQIPYVLGHVRTEKDSVGNFCEVVDIAFSQNTIKACKQEVRFAQIVIQTAIEAVETSAKFKFHQKYKVLKNITSQGEPAMMSINTSKTPTLKQAWSKNEKNEKNEDQTQFVDEDNVPKAAKGKGKKSKHKSKIKHSRNRNKNNSSKQTNNNKNNNNQTSSASPPTASATQAEVANDATQNVSNKMEQLDEKSVEPQEKVVKPEYRIVESGDMNLQDFWSDKSLIVAPLRRPQRLILKIELPTLRNVAHISASIVNSNETDKNNQNMDKLTQYFELIDTSQNETKYELKIKLPYPVVTSENAAQTGANSLNSNFSNMSAHWYEVTKELHITLTVQPFSKQEIESFRQQMLRLKMKTSSVVADVEQTQAPATAAHDASATQSLESNQNVKNNNDKVESAAVGPGAGTELDVSAIDKILKLDASSLKIDVMDATDARDETGTNATCATGVTKIVSKKKEVGSGKESKGTKKGNKRKERRGAIQSGFLLNVGGDGSGLGREDVCGKNTSETLERDLSVKEVKKCNYEFRERLNRIVLVYRVSNIIEKSVNVVFENRQICVSFETKANGYYDKLKLKEEIECSKCSFDVNCKNLLIMLMKKDEQLWNQVEPDESQARQENQETQETQNGQNRNHENDKQTIVQNLLDDETSLDLE